MRYVFFTGIILLGAFLAFNKSTQPQTKNEMINSVEPANKVVFVELFTSQGCSSCPPADRLLGAMQEEYGNDLIALSFHVDYWNRLGWKDPYSKPAFSDRQRDYAQSFRNHTIYTPQAVVNGSTEFVGSKRTDFRNAIKNKIPELTLKDFKQTGQSLTFNLVDGNHAKHTKLYLAKVLNKAENKVARGENRGRQLSHINVVKSLQYKKFAPHFTFKTDPLEENEFYVVWLQSNEGKILAAKRL